ncbi:lysylphosphatidylglycerol synthase transmembrane domain-containing protein [Spirillospora sp. NPDC047279]|uniref:lysylphosphatidylglycerol synthase transmembrane domain-containing protein n=1 Tax=Spirillospora sp. NPDC047279 TaxID=3155478 RepID=UPI0033E680DC
MAETVVAPERAEAPARPWLARHRGLVVQVVMLSVAAGFLIAMRDQLPDLGAMWASATHAEPGWMAVVVLASAGSMAAFARLQRRLLRVGGVRVSLRRAFAVTYAGNALSTTLPAGPAVSVVYTFRQFRRTGASAQLSAAVILVGGIITTTAYTVIGLLALLADPRARVPAALALAVPMFLLLTLVLAYRRPALRARVAGPLGRAGAAVLAHRRIAPHAERLREGRAALRPTGRDWAALTTLATLNWVFDILALAAAARAVGIDVAPQGVTLVYFAAQAAGSLLPLLPGGIGAIESSMAASLVAFGAALAPAGAAVGLYRLASYWAVVTVGWLAWLALHEGPRLSEQTRCRLSAAGRAAMGGLTAVAFTTPYTVAPTSTPRPRNS